MVIFTLQGKTGFPWIDACMNQLRIEGWIHHTARHAVSCFLTRGDLWIHWEDGLKVYTYMSVLKATLSVMQQLYIYLYICQLFNAKYEAKVNNII